MSERAAARVPMPPWHQFRNVLAPAEHKALLDWTIDNRGRFEPAGLAELGVDRSKRIAERLRDLGPLECIFQKRMRALLPEIFARVGTRPFEVEHLELEIAAHGDGAFFARHSDMAFGPAAARSPATIAGARIVWSAPSIITIASRRPMPAARCGCTGSAAEAAPTTISMSRPLRTASSSSQAGRSTR